MKPIWTMEQVVALNHRQRDKSLHPYTCNNRHDHPEFDGDKGVLVATVYGWMCPFCDYRQGWAHEVQHDGIASTSTASPCPACGYGGKPTPPNLVEQLEFLRVIADVRGWGQAKDLLATSIKIQKIARIEQGERYDR